jgi:hypothetical protein
VIARVLAGLDTTFQRCPPFVSFRTIDVCEPAALPGEKLGALSDKLSDPESGYDKH